MEVLRKSLVAKTALIVFGTLLVVGAVDVTLGDTLVARLGSYAPLAFFAIAAVVIFVLVYLLLYKPLGTIFNEMKLLLTGHPYKKIFTNRIDEVGVMAHFFNEVTKNIERIAGEVAEGKRMSKELSVGNDIQKKILPKEMPRLNNMVIFGSTRPASEVGGDSFDIIPTAKNTFVYVGDVTGHGLPAALIMVMVNTLIRTFSEIHASGYDIMVNTNRILKQRIEPRRFMTCVLLRWSEQEKKLYYTGAGHEHIIIYHKQQRTCEVRQTGGIALGMVPDIAKIVKEEVIPFEPGDFVVLYTDGITEAKNMQGEMFGVNRLKEEVERYAAADACAPEQLFNNISKDFGQFVGDQVQEDDITLIALQRTS